MTGRLLALATIVVLAAAVVLGWGAGDTPLPPPARAERLPWALPAMSQADPAPDLAVLRARRPWGTAAPPAAEDAAARIAAARAAAAKAARAALAAAVPWRLAGIVERGPERFALIATGPGTGAAVTYLRVGDRLPDGSVLAAIAADSATTAAATAPGQQRVYRLFGEKR